MQRQIVKKQQAAKTFWRPLVITLLTIGAVVGGAGIALDRIMHNPETRNKARYFAKRYYNPVAGKFAGGRFRLYSLLRHTGRHSGHEYVTPVGAFPFDDGFVIPMPYGRNTDWCRNILAAGTCTLRYDNREYTLERPEIKLRTELQNAFPRILRLIFIRGNVKEVLWLHKQEAPVSTNHTVTVH